MFALAFASSVGRDEELDSMCQRAAVEGLRGSDLPEGFKVFVNVEPGKSVAALTERTTGPKLVAEITERALMDKRRSCSDRSARCATVDAGSRSTTWAPCYSGSVFELSGLRPE
jgi:EAL domain-containing protein (putative c-di-GMP-specific phosphodiesterase class I)